MVLLKHRSLPGISSIARFTADQGPCTLLLQGLDRQLLCTSRSARRISQSHSKHVHPRTARLAGERLERPENPVQLLHGISELKTAPAADCPSLALADTPRARELLGQWADRQTDPGRTPSAVSVRDARPANWQCPGCPRCGIRHTFSATVNARYIRGALPDHHQLPGAQELAVPDLPCSQAATARSVRDSACVPAAPWRLYAQSLRLSGTML